MKKKFLATILVTTMLISLVGCSALTSISDGFDTVKNITKINEVLISTSDETVVSENNTNQYDVSQNTPVENDAQSINGPNTSAPNTELIANPNELVVGMRLGDAIDLTSYNEILDNLVRNNDTIIDLKGVLPFESYIVVPDYGLVNAYTYHYEDDFGASEHSIMSSSILGDTDSVMIVKMNASDTYAFLIREPYDYWLTNCNFDDLANYKIVEVGLTQKEVETMVIPNSDSIDLEYYEKFMKQYRIASKEIDTLGEYIASQPGTARFFVYDGFYEQHEELSEFNLDKLAETNMIYIYYGNNLIPTPYEDLLAVETEFDYSVTGLFLSEVLERLMLCPFDLPKTPPKEDVAYSSLHDSPTVSQDVIDIMLEMGYPADTFDFSYDQWIDASHFPDNICTDIGILWALSIINDEIGGTLLNQCSILNQKEILQEMDVTSLPYSDMAAIMNPYTSKYCFIAKVHNQTGTIERENVTTILSAFSDYNYTVHSRSEKENKKLGAMSIFSSGPYVWMFYFDEIQGVEDSSESFSPPNDKYLTLQTRIDSLFSYLYFLSIKD